MKLPSVAIVGAGRVGVGIGALLFEKGYNVTGVVCRSQTRAEEAVALIGGGMPYTDPVQGVSGADVVFLTVPDQKVRSVAQILASARRWRAENVVVHTSGALTADVMRVQGLEEAQLLSMHPMQTVADRYSAAARLRGVTWGIEGDARAMSMARRLILNMEGEAFQIDSASKVLYHAAASVVCNYLVTLIDVGLSLYQQAGIDRSDALQAVMPLLEGTLANARELGVPRALTGPIERGDIDTVRMHLKALANLPDEAEQEQLVGLYRVLGQRTLKLVEEKHGELSFAHRGICELLSGM